MKTKKQFFKEKVEAVTYSMWDLEFKLAKSRQVREGVRQDRDRVAEAVGQVVAKLSNAGKDKAVIKALEEERDKLLEDQKRYEAQMAMVDKQINGFNGSDTEEPVIGILEQLASLNELKGMYQDFLKKI